MWEKKWSPQQKKKEAREATWKPQGTSKQELYLKASFDTHPRWSRWSYEFIANAIPKLLWIIGTHKMNQTKKRARGIYSLPDHEQWREAKPGLPLGPYAALWHIVETSKQLKSTETKGWNNKEEEPISDYWHSDRSRLKQQGWNRTMINSITNCLL